MAPSPPSPGRSGDGGIRTHTSIHFKWSASYLLGYVPWGQRSALTCASAVPARPDGQAFFPGFLRGDRPVTALGERHLVTTAVELMDQRPGTACGC